MAASYCGHYYVSTDGGSCVGDWLTPRRRSILPLRASVRVTLLFLLALIAGFAAITPMAGAQAVPAPIAAPVAVRGSVQDSTGAVLPGALIRAYQGDQQIAETTAAADGRFTILLAPGDYRIEISSASFSLLVSDLTVRAGIAPLALKMDLAPVQQTLNVQDDPYQISLEPDRNLSGLVLDDKAIQDLPEDEDELMQLLVDLAGPGADAAGGATFSIDGFAGSGRLPPRDQIREVRINNNPFSAEHDQSGRGRIEIITRAGGDSLRGSFGFNFRDEALNARNAFAPSKPPLQERSWRGNFSGPLIRQQASFSFFARRSVNETSSTQNPTTLAGPLFFSVLTPNKRQEYDGRIQYNLPRNHFLNLALEYGTDSNRSLGGGGGFRGGGSGSGVSLPERATQSNGKDIEMQIRETAPLSEHLINEVRFAFSRGRSITRSLSNGVSVTVLDSFEGGSADRHNEQTDRHYEFANILSYSKGKLSLRGGFQGEYRQFHTLNQDNFIGAFEFASLDNFAAGIPTTFSITRGNPLLDMGQFQMSLFTQADYRFSQKLMLSFGTRYQAQTNSPDKFNLDPRFGFAYGVGNNSVLRGGVGIFHQRLSAGTVQSVMRLDGTRQIQTVLSYCQSGESPADGCIAPSFPDPFATGGSALSVAPSIRRADENLSLPYSINSSIAFETRLPRGLFVSASYNFVRGLHLYRSPNINAPLPGETDPPDPDFKNILFLESSASSRYNDLSVRVNQRLGRHSLNFNYTLSKSFNDTNGATSTPASTYDLTGEWGRSSDNRRHTVFAGTSVQLPWGVSSNLRIRANTGRPYTITTGNDDNDDTFTNDRPAGVARNTETGPGFFNMDLGFRKTFNLTRQEPAPRAANAPAGANFMQQGPGGGFPGGGFPGGGGGNNNNNRRGPQMSVSINVSNLLNHTNLNRFSGVQSSPNFGKATSSGSPREIQLGLQFNF